MFQMPVEINDFDQVMRNSVEGHLCCCLLDSFRGVLFDSGDIWETIDAQYSDCYSDILCEERCRWRPQADAQGISGAHTANDQPSGSP